MENGGINAGSAIATLFLNRSPFSDGLTSAKKELETFGNSNKSAEARISALGETISTVGATMTKGLTLPLLGAGAAAMKVGNDFEAQMSRVQAISGSTGAEFKKLNDLALKLGADTSFSAGEAAEGMENLASAGFSVNEIVSAMPGMLDLAASSGEGLASSADIAASTLRGFGLEASQAAHVADVLARAAADTNAGVADTGEAMKYVAPVAHAMGLSLEEVTAAIGEMSNAGIKGGQAGTTLRSALTRLANPSDEAAKLMKKLSFSAYDSHGKMLPLKDVIEKLQGSMKKLSEQQRQQAIATIFGQEAMSGMLTLIDAGPKELDKLTQSFKNSDGAAKDMAGTMLNNTKGSIEAMKGSLETAGILIQQTIAPYVKNLADRITELINKFNSLPESTRKTIVSFAGFAAAAGPALMVGGKFITTTSSIISTVSKLSGIIGKATVATEGIGAAASIAGGAGGVAGLGVALGSAALAAAPFLIAGAAVAGAGYAVYKAMKEEAVPAVDLFADKVEYTSKVVTDEYGNMSTQIDSNTTKISESTKKAVGAYMQMDTDVTKTMTNLYINSTKITNGTVTSLTSKFDSMGTQIKTGIDNKYNDIYSTMQAFFKESGALADIEEAEALRKLKENNDFQKGIVDQGTKEIKAILDKASKEKREITEQERIVIKNIQDNMKQDAVKSLSETELESKVILERLKAYSTRITAEQSAEIVKNANDTRDKAINAANDQYNKTIAAIIKMRDESHSITADQADKLIRNATKQKDDAIAKAEEMRNGVVGKLREMNPDVEKEVNFQTGTIMTAWDKVKKWWNNLTFTKKTMEVDTKYNYSSLPSYTTGSNLFRNAPAYAAVGHNASGTDYWLGGLTTLHEKGYEVYDLPQGTRIYNHEASEDMVMKTAENIARGVLQGINKGNDTHQTIIVPVNLDGKQIAQVIAPYTDRIQGSNFKLAGRSEGI
jgi:TP901 family phage tail tape measure protein